MDETVAISIEKLKGVAENGAFALDVKESKSWQAISARFALLANAYRAILEKMDFSKPNALVRAEVYQKLIQTCDGFARSIPDQLLNEGKAAYDELKALGIELLPRGYDKKDSIFD
jgi:hypothetical protein